jgi:hypothetical protein
MAPADIIGRLPLLRLRTAVDVAVEDIFGVKETTQYSSDEVDERRRRTMEMGGVGEVGGESVRSERSDGLDVCVSMVEKDGWAGDVVESVSTTW